MTDADAALGPSLPRQLTELSDAVRRVPRPPVPVLAAPFAVRVVDADADAPLVSQWMNRPHLAVTWEYAHPVAWWRRHLRAQVDGDYSLPLLMSFKGVDHGYLELYRAAKDSIAPRYDAEPYDLGLHAAIADLRIVNRGMGPMLLPKIVASVFALEPQCRRVLFDPDHRNVGARRLCEFVGCRFLGEHDMANRRMALYAFERPTIAS